MKRFTETEKWSDKWFRRLSVEHKLAWLYLLDICDSAGVAQVDDELSEFQIGCRVDWQTFIAASDGRVEALPSGKLWIKPFISFHYPDIDLSADGGVAKGIRRRLEKHGLTKGSGKGIDTLLEGSKNPTKIKIKKEIETKTEGGAGETAFAAWWAEYPKKVGKKAAKRAYEKAAAEIDGRDEPGGDNPHEFLQACVKAFAASPKGRGEFCPNPATWLNEGRYDDDQAAWRPAEEAAEVLRPLSREDFLLAGRSS